MAYIVFIPASTVLYEIIHIVKQRFPFVNPFCKNEITRLDTDVLARLCTALECDISDLLEFVPPNKK